MTPLAHRIVKELTLPLKDRTYPDQSAPRDLEGIHCFDVSEVSALAAGLGEKMVEVGIPTGVCSFLPFPKVWIETNTFPYGGRAGVRLAILLEEDGGDCAITVFHEDGRSPRARFNLSGIEGSSAEVLAAASSYTGTPAIRETAWIWAILAMINTPRIIGRQQHMPHRGLERRLAKTKGLVGKFPLHAWTELKLRVSTMGTDASGKTHEAHLTGEKCYHWCRAHIRIRLGRLEIVKAHERGNPALGIKRTRYKLAA